MYNNESNPGINWKDIIIKIIFLVVFILLLIWLFPKVPNMKAFYSNVFRENIKYMEEAAESYFTNEKLPNNIGESTEMTLQEMINKKIIIPFVDEDGKDCDTTASYVKVTKNTNDYTLKINLVCPKESDYTEKTLGCYDYCEDCDTKYEYEFKQAYTSAKVNYTCPNGGVLTNTTCNIYKTTSYEAIISEEEGIEYCPKGGTLKDGRCYIESTSSYEPSIKYTCPEGSKLEGKLCYSTTIGGSYNPTKNTTCPTGYTLSNGKCTKSVVSTINATAKTNTTYSCPSGYTQNGTTCSIATTLSIAGNPHYQSYGCGSSLQPVCNYGVCTGYKMVYSCAGTYIDYYTCPDGYKVDGKNCTKSSVSNINATPNTTTTYTCPSGYTKNGTTCSITTIDTKTPVVDYTCPNGGTYNGKVCKYADISTSTNANQALTCPKGGTLKDSKCIIDTTSSYKSSISEGTKIKTCPKGGNLKNGICSITEFSSSYYATKNTTNSTSYKYQWSTQETIEGWERTGKSRIVK